MKLAEPSNPITTDDPKILLWVAVRDNSSNAPECNYKCPRCNQTTQFHPNFINSGVARCSRKGCYKLEEIVPAMCAFRNWIYKEIYRGDCKGKVMFVCNQGHLMKMEYKNFRLGCNCKKCNRFNKNKNTFQATCDCEVLNIGFRNKCSHSWICEHYNHAVLYPDSASEWDYENPLNNEVTPDRIEPASNKQFWFKCRECKMPYPQILGNRVQGNRCPYCKGQKVCEWNCLATKRPELLEEWDYDHPLNKGIHPTKVTCGTKTEVWWICHKHENGPFRWPALIFHRAGNHKTGCPRCNNTNYDQEVGGHEYFVQAARKVHGDRYEYPDTYINSSTKINILCKKHGIFRQTPNSHKRGANCFMCTKHGPQTLGGHEYFVQVARKIHGNKYEYMDEYINDKSKINILCKKHGLFNQRPNNHKQGQGCKSCVKEEHESKPIKILKAILDELKIKYIIEERFEGLKYKLELRIDIFLPDYKLCIEYDGQQHFRIVESWGGEKTFLNGRIRDMIKDVYCVKNGLSLLRIPYNAHISKELILYMIEESKKAQLYASYPLYMQQTAESLSESGIDLSKLNTIPIQMPEK